MSRVTTAPVRHRRHKKILKKAKGFRGGRSKLYRTAREAVMRSLASSYRGRKEKKRVFRRLWITRIRAGVIPEGLSYSRFMHYLKQTGVRIDRKILAELAVNQPDLFSQLVRKIKKLFSEG